MLNNILRFREVRVEDVMVPRADIEAVEINTTLGELMNLFEQSGHSRMPVYAETLDDPRGMVHIRDIVAHITRLARVKKDAIDEEAGRPPLELNLGQCRSRQDHRRARPDPGPCCSCRPRCSPPT